MIKPVRLFLLGAGRFVGDTNSVEMSHETLNEIRLDLHRSSFVLKTKELWLTADPPIVFTTFPF